MTERPQAYRASSSLDAAYRIKLEPAVAARLDAAVPATLAMATPPLTDEDLEIEGFASLDEGKAR